MWWCYKYAFSVLCAYTVIGVSTVLGASGALAASARRSIGVSRGRAWARVSSESSTKEGLITRFMVRACYGRVRWNKS